MNRLEIESRGFSVLKDYNSWRIAVLGYDNATNSLEGINKLGRHYETDEVFVLIKGKAYMLTTGVSEIPSNITIEQLNKGYIYIVKEKEWHAALLEPESILLIIENQNTNDDNSADYIIHSKDKTTIEKIFIEKFAKNNYL